MINGSGQGNQLWTNSLGKKTADVAFLAPTAIALQLGPTVNNLSYVGWVNRLDIVHNMFTESMIPIHSEVTVSLTAFSQVSLSTGGI
jgi:hypothetical protein